MLLTPVGVKEVGQTERDARVLRLAVECHHRGPRQKPQNPQAVRKGTGQLNPATDIHGAHRLVDIFGEWPSFHDAEVIDARLDRRGRDDFEGPVLWLRFHLFQGRRDSSTQSGVTWYNHTIATLRFGNVRDFAMNGFNGQNAILELCLEKGGGHPQSSAVRAIKVSVKPSFGVGCSFVCGSVEVTGVESGIPADSVYSE